MLRRSDADRVVLAYLTIVGRHAGELESAQMHEDVPSGDQFVITQVFEFEFGWVYYFSSARFKETGDFKDMPFGAAPIVVDRTDCRLYATSPNHSLGHVVDNFRRGVREPLW